jgi:ABC-type antimicrobial peptide transport system permease subunit
MGPTLDVAGGESAGPLFVPGLFGVLALLLAVIGVFGVMSQLVDERRVELGVRLALGASPRGLVRLVVRDGLIRVGVGAGLGLAGLAASVRTGFAGLLQATAPDPWLWLGVVVPLTLSALAACYLPARRAASVDPMVALRAE